MREGTIKRVIAIRNNRRDYVLFKNASRAEEIALYYGFKPTDIPLITKDDLAQAKHLAESESKPRSIPEGNQCYFDICPEEKIALLRLYFEKNMQSLPQPVCLFLEGHFGTNPSKKHAHEESRYTLEMLGTSKSIAEATLIKTAVEILRAEGFENLYLDINSIGDRDSIVRFHKELVIYYRKNLQKLESHCRQTFKRDPFELFECENELCLTLKEEAPKSMAFLSEQSRIHFKEVLEYLESIDIPYRINPYIVGNRLFSTHTIFQIRSLSEKEENISWPLAVGVRYNALSKKLGMRRDLPAIGVTIAYKKKGHVDVRKEVKMKKSKIFFIQLGFDAKLKSLSVIEMLRQEGIAVEQSLSRDKLASQFALAESMRISFSLIMGQKEAMDNTVIVRNMDTRSQETVHIENIVEYLKKLK